MTHRIEFLSARTARWGALLVVALLCACSSKNQDVAVVDTEPQVTPTPIGPLKAAEIMQALSNRTFKYTRGSRTGTVTFNSDGTFGYEEVGKGPGTGVWQASDGALCEAFDPTSFLPQGTRSECQPFKAAGGKFYAGSARFEPM
ncbi:MAG: hypothetical protein JNM20_02785 [Rhizobiales bacterium]|nr:hypothetical protein [Hyphomicrobiales bacterium]